MTVPTDGEPLIKVFNGNGGRVDVPGTEVPVSISPLLPVGFAGGGRACGADVDYDGQQEVVYLPGAGGEPLVQAFELDGLPVIGFEPFTGPGPGLATTDRFVRK